MLTYAGDVCWRMLTYAMTYAYVCWCCGSIIWTRWRMLTYADICCDVCLRMLMLRVDADVCWWRMLTYADLCYDVCLRMLMLRVDNMNQCADYVVSHELKEAGVHIMICSGSYLDPSGILVPKIRCFSTCVPAVLRQRAYNDLLWLLLRPLRYFSDLNFRYFSTCVQVCSTDAACRHWSALALTSTPQALLSLQLVYLLYWYKRTKKMICSGSYLDPSGVSHSMCVCVCVCVCVYPYLDNTLSLSLSLSLSVTHTHTHT
jgi:hypothetical protein